MPGLRHRDRPHRRATTRAWRVGLTQFPPTATRCGIYRWGRVDRIGPWLVLVAYSELGFFAGFSAGRRTVAVPELEFVSKRLVLGADSLNAPGNGVHIRLGTLQDLGNLTAASADHRVERPFALRGSRHRGRGVLDPLTNVIEVSPPRGHDRNGPVDLRAQPSVKKRGCPESTRVAVIDECVCVRGRPLPTTLRRGGLHLRLEPQQGRAFIKRGPVLRNALAEGGTRPGPYRHESVRDAQSPILLSATQVRA